MKAKERKKIKMELYNWLWENFKGQYTMQELTKALGIPLSTFARYIMEYRKQQEAEKVKNLNQNNE
jgi:Fic family protein